MSTITTADSIKQEVSLTEAVMETKKNSFAKLLISKSKQANSTTITKQTITPRVGSTQGEGLDVTGDGKTKAKRTPVTNQMAIYTDLIQISRTSGITDSFGANAEVQASTLGLVNFLENMAINGATVEGRTNKGLIGFIPTANKPEIKIVAGATLTGTQLSTALKCLKADADLVICGYNAALRLDALAKQNNVDNWNGVFSGKIDQVSVRNADAIVIISDAMADDQALFLNTDFLERDYLTNAQVKKLQESRYDGTEFKLVEESCVMYTMPNALALVTFTDVPA